MKIKSKRIFGLDVIRSIAITLVILSHCTYILPPFNITITNGARLLGATGVDIFFVLSGYLIGGILLEYFENGLTQFNDLLHFWKRRWLRTLPNYFTVLILNILLVLFLKENLINRWWLYIPFLQNFTASHPNFFTEAWSLSIEEYAYIVLPFVLFSLTLTFKKIKPVKIFYNGTIVLILLLFILKLFFFFNSDVESYKDWSSKFRKVFIYRLDAIYYGFILVYILRNVSMSLVQKRRLAIVGVILFIKLHVVLLVFNITPQSYTLLFSVLYLPLISISIALVFAWIISLKPSKTFSILIRYISTRSYSIYLVNYSLILLTFKRFVEPSILVMILYLMMTICFSELLYRLIEIPFLRLRSRIVPRK